MGIEQLLVATVAVNVHLTPVLSAQIWAQEPAVTTAI